MAPRTATSRGGAPPAPHLDPDRADGALGVGLAQHRQPGGEPVAPGGGQPGGHPVDAGEGLHQQQGVGQGGPVAVGGADRVGEPAQLAARAAGRRCTQPPSRQSRAVPAEGPVVLAGAGRAAGAEPGDVDLVDLVEARRPRGGRARRSARARSRRRPPPGRPGPRPRARGRAGPATSTMASEADTTGTSAVDQLARPARRGAPGGHGQHHRRRPRAGAVIARRLGDGDRRRARRRPRRRRSGRSSRSRTASTPSVDAS